ncbi:MAG: carboxypeptidase regulatory-like domain-containing protein [Bryobacteraceae bacterium]|jgi:hypothetical protein
MSLKRIELMAVLFCLSLSTASAQFGSAIQGVITDPSGTAVPNAVVHVTDVNTGIAREATTANDGLYRVTNLGLGTYRLNIEVPGFAPEERPNVHVDLNETVRADFALKIGTVVDRVTVTEQVALVDTEVGQVSAAIEPVKLNELPMNGKNVFTLLAFQPGVTGISVSPTFRAGPSAQADTFAGETEPAINANGQRVEQNTYTLDGSFTNSPYSNGTNLTPNADSLEEVRVIANNFSAEFGRGAAARIEMISKGGSNAFHGGASDYFQNNTLSDRNVFEGPISAFRRNQFAYNLGGRIKRDRTFFFTSYEGLRMSGGRASIVTVLTPAFENWVEQALPNGIAAQVLNVAPAAAIPTSGFVLASSIAAPAGLPTPPAGLEAYGNASWVPTTQTRSGNQFSVRIDHELRPSKDKVFGNYYHTNSASIVPNVYTIFSRGYDEKTTFLSLNETHIFSPTKVNELRFGMMRYQGWEPNSNDDSIPLLNITPISAIGIDSQPLGWFQYSFNTSETFSWIHGSHSFKAGGEWRKIPTDTINTSAYIPAYYFSNVLNFAADTPYQENRYVDPATGLPVINDEHYRRHEESAFVMDDWKPLANLTLNIGLRWENFPPATDPTGHNNSLVFPPGPSIPQELANAKSEYVKYGSPFDYHNFGPRFGLAWNPGGHGTMAIRAGFGIVYDRSNNLLSWGGNSPYHATVTMGSLYGTSFAYSLGNPSEPFLGYPVDAGLKAGINAEGGINGLKVSESTVDPKFTTAYDETWMFGLQRQLHQGWMAELDYTGSEGHHLYDSVNIDRFDGDLLNGGVFHGFNPAFSTIGWQQSVSNSVYQGVTGSVKRTFTKGVLFETYFNLGKVLTDADSDSTATYQDVWNRAAERSPASFDVARRLALVGVWQVPFFKGQKGPAAWVLGGWQIALTGIMQSGMPVNVTSSAVFPKGDWTADGTTGDARPDAPAASVQRSGFSRAQYIHGMFPASVFPIPTLGTDGTLGRNAFRGPGFIQPDGSLSKTFALTERVSLHVKMDAYNVANRVNLLQPTMDVASSSFGISTSQQTPRTFQAYVRLMF